MKKEPKYKVGDRVHILLDEFEWEHPDFGHLRTIFESDYPYEILHVYDVGDKYQYEIEGHCMLLFDDEDLAPFEDNKE